MSDLRTPAAEAMLRALAIAGIDCPHPPAMRLPPPFPSSDPSEYRCGVCFTDQVATWRTEPHP